MNSILVTYNNNVCFHEWVKLNVNNIQNNIRLRFFQYLGRTLPLGPCLARSVWSQFGITVNCFLFNGLKRHYHEETNYFEMVHNFCVVFKPTSSPLHPSPPQNKVSQSFFCVYKQVYQRKLNAGRMRHVKIYKYCKYS